jgi:hypothetical protein
MIKFHLDTLKELSEKIEEGGELDIAGWVIHKNHKIDAIKIVQGFKSEVISLTVNRPLLKKNNPDWYVDNSGFNKRIEISRYVPIFIFAEIQGESIECYRMDDFQVKPVLFVHIAKTAGSSVNDFLRSKVSGNSYLHVESTPNWNSIQFSGEHFISGHLTYSEFKNKLNADRYFKVVTLRNPVDHIISHISWIRKIADDIARFEAHPTYIQNLSLKLKNTDLSNPEELRETISSFTVQEIALLDNAQTRYLRDNAGNRPVNSSDVSSAIKNSKLFDVVGCSENLDDFLAEVSRLKNWDFLGESPHKNRLNEKFGLNDRADLVEVLMPLIQYDIKLYTSFF